MANNIQASESFGNGSIVFGDFIPRVSDEWAAVIAGSNISPAIMSFKAILSVCNCLSSCGLMVEG